VVTIVLILLLQMICGRVHADQTSMNQQRVDSPINSNPSEASFDSKNFCTHDEVAAVCLTCAAEIPGPSVSACCSQGSVFNACADRVLLQLLGSASSESQMAIGDLRKVGAVAASLNAARARNEKIFPGKSNEEIGDEILDGDVAEEMEFEGEKKRGRSPFLGKRRSPFLGKRRSPFLGKRNDEEKNEEEKRGRSPFLGKRRMPFLG